jgi:solute carrier family 35 (UDP-galactose transporter), member B1
MARPVAAATGTAGLGWLAFCVAGIYVCFLTWGVLQERVSTRQYATGTHTEKYDAFIVLNAVQAAVATVWALVYGALRGHAVRWPRPSMAVGYLQLGLAACVGAYSGYRSLDYINFPLLVLSKSCKLVPVMLVQTTLFGKRYPWHKVLSVALVTVGVAWFFFLKPGKGGGSGDNSGHVDLAVGLALVAVNLLLDGFINAKEDSMFRREGMTAQDLQVFMNLAQVALMALFLLVDPVGDGELARALAFVGRHPAALSDILLFAGAGALGQTFVFLTLEAFGSIVLVTITVTRKLVTIVLSVLWFGHAIVPLQWAAVAVVFAGIGIESFGERLLHRKQA